MPVSYFGILSTKVTDMLEIVRRRAMKRIKGMKYLIYEERLRKLGLFSLEKRTLRVVVCICVFLFNVFKYLERSCK